MLKSIITRQDQETFVVYLQNAENGLNARDVMDVLIQKNGAKTFGDMLKHAPLDTVIGYAAALYQKTEDMRASPDERTANIGVEVDKLFGKVVNAALNLHLSDDNAHDPAKVVDALLAKDLEETNMRYTPQQKQR